MTQTSHQPAPAAPPAAADAAAVPQAIVRLPIDDLEEHPNALAFWPDSEQRREAIEAIHTSVRALGVRQPLTVCRRDGDQCWWVIDGCTRLVAARAAGLKQVPCRVIEADEETVEDEIFISNMERTRFPSGLRIMRYLERNLAEVLATAKANADPARTGARGGRGNKGGVSDTPFSSKAIAERLKVSNKDVLGGIELLRCKYEGMMVRCTRDTRTLVPATEEEREGIRRAYDQVLAGTPLRRWLPAATGRTATAGRAKAATDYSALTARTLRSLGTVFANWDEIAEMPQQAYLQKFRQLLSAAPPEVLLVVRKVARLLPPM